MRTILLAAMGLLGAAQGAGGTYYLSPAGNDGGDGSAARPWLTLAHAAGRIPDNGK